MDEMRDIELDKIEPNPNQPRKDFDQDALEELARSIKATGGVLEPIVVRPNGDSKYMIVAGERRWRASQIAEMGTVSAIIRDVDDKAMALLSLVENLVRRDLNVAEQGHFLKQLLDDGIEWDEICAQVGQDRQYLEWKVDVVLRCVPEIVWLVQKGTITGNMAWRLSKLSENGQRRFLREIIAKPMTQQEQIGLIDAIWGDEHQSDMFPEVVLTEEERTAAADFKLILERTIRVAERLEKLEAARPGTLGAAMATQLDTSVLKIGQLVSRLSGIRRSLQRRQGQKVAGKEKVA